MLLAGLAVAVTRTPTRPALLASAAILAGLIAAYGLATTTGVPVLHPERESIDALALATKAVEAVGLLAAAAALPRTKGTPA